MRLQVTGRSSCQAVGLARGIACREVWANHFPFHLELYCAPAEIHRMPQRERAPAPPRCILASNCSHRVLSGCTKNGRLQYSGRRLTPATQIKFGGGTCDTCHRGPICCESCFVKHSCEGNSDVEPATSQPIREVTEVIGYDEDSDEGMHQGRHHGEEVATGAKEPTDIQFPMLDDAFVSGLSHVCMHGLM